MSGSKLAKKKNLYKKSAHMSIREYLKTLIKGQRVAIIHQGNYNKSRPPYRVYARTGYVENSLSRYMYTVKIANKTYKIHRIHLRCLQ